MSTRKMVKRVKKQGKKQSLETSWASHPPLIRNIPLTHSVRMRYIGTAAFNLGVTYQNLLDTWLFTTTTTVAYDVFATVKLRRVSIWANPVIGTASSVTVGFRGLTVGQAGPGSEATDTSIGISPAHVSLRPNMKSQAAQYQPSSANVAFDIEGPAGSVIDVEATFQQIFGYTKAAQNAIVGTAGFIAVRGLDGLASASTNFPPTVDTSV